jgi:predicted unusual protein kinase regulating ubiquinone biosynthesis (AarF/ABC1/UbiB family)
MLRVTAPSQDVDGLIAELRDRVLEELDYRKEAVNQQRLHDYFAAHPTISVPAIVAELSGRRVVTSELVTGTRFADIAGWPQHERDLAGETLYRFVFRSLYEVHAFNGDPHPGNYIFHGGGRVTFLDFGMVKHFTDTDLLPLMQMARNLCVDDDPARFRASLEEAGFLVPGAPLRDDQIAEHLAVFYQLIRESKTVTVTGDYASSVVRRFFDVRSPVAQYARIPRSYVVLQRINLGLFALLGEISATANWRAIAEEIWPFMQAPPSTAMGEAELPWLASRPAPARALALP